MNNKFTNQYGTLSTKEQELINKLYNMYQESTLDFEFDYKGKPIEELIEDQLQAYFESVDPVYGDMDSDLTFEEFLETVSIGEFGLYA